MITANATPLHRVPTIRRGRCVYSACSTRLSGRAHYVETIRAYVDWTTRFILLHGKRHHCDLTNAEVGRFLGHVVKTHKEALRAIEVGRTTGGRGD